VPSYLSLNAGLTKQFFNYNWQPGNTFGTYQYQNTVPAPPIDSLDLDYGATGGAGTVNRVCHASGTGTNVTPGTTDTFNLDLTALVDPQGTAITDMTKLVAIVTFNFAMTDGSYLTIGPATANPFSSMFSGTGGVIVGPGYIYPGDGSNKYGVDLRVAGNASAYAIASGNKGIKITTGTSVSLPFRTIILGRTA
jgi:hypothetical protein